MCTFSNRHQITIRVAMFLVAACVTTGCGLLQRLSAPKQDANASAAAADPRELRRVLRVLDDDYREIVTQTDTALRAASDDDPEIVASVQAWRDRMLSEGSSAFQLADPATAIADYWFFTLQMRDSLSDGADRDLFGPHQSIARRAARRLVSLAEATAQRVYRDDVIDQVGMQFQELAANKPLPSVLSDEDPPALSDTPGTENQFALLGKPFEWLGQGFSATTRSLDPTYSLSQSIDRASETASRLPASTRREATQLADHVLDDPTVMELLAALKQLTETVNNLPKEIASSVDTSLGRAETTLPKLDTTLTQTTTALEALQASLAQAEAVTDSVTGTAGAFEQTLTAARELSDSLRALTVELKPLLPQSGPDADGAETAGTAETTPTAISTSASPATTSTETAATTSADSSDDASAQASDASPSDVRAITAAATDLRDTVTELRGLLGDARDLLEADVISDQVRSVDGAVADAIGRYEQSADQFAASLVVRLGFLTGIVGAVVLVVGVLLQISRRLLLRQPGTP